MSFSELVHIAGNRTMLFSDSTTFGIVNAAPKQDSTFRSFLKHMRPKGVSGLVTLKDQDSRRGSRWSVTSIRGQVQAGVLHFRERHISSDPPWTDVRKTQDAEVPETSRGRGTKRWQSLK